MYLLWKQRCQCPEFRETIQPWVRHNQEQPTVWTAIYSASTRLMVVAHSVQHPKGVGHQCGVVESEVLYGSAYFQLNWRGGIKQNARNVSLILKNILWPHDFVANSCLLQLGAREQEHVPLTHGFPLGSPGQCVAPVQWVVVESYPLCDTKVAPPHDQFITPKWLPFVSRNFGPKIILNTHTHKATMHLSRKESRETFRRVWPVSSLRG